MTSRDLLQIVELDVQRCFLDYGTAPCGAVLGTTGVRKCYQTRATCQDLANFRQTPEPTDQDTTTKYEQLDTILATSFDRTKDVSFSVDLEIPDKPEGTIWELGGATGGAYCGFTSGDLVFRAGSGASAFPADAAKLVISDTADLVNKTGTLHGIADMSDYSVSLWWSDYHKLNTTFLGKAVASSPPFPGLTWSGPNTGGCGKSVDATIVGEDTSDYNGVINELRMYDDTLYQDNSAMKKLRFCKNQSGFRRADRIYPALKSVSTNPTEINLGGVSDRKGSLGKRARVKVNLQDFPDSDTWFDSYQSERVDGTAQTDEGGYNPLDRGTFFGKMRNRFPYYIGRMLTVYEGYSGQSINTMRYRSYVVTEWSGPDANGNVQITAADILDLADNAKAQAPQASSGALGSDIDDTSLAEFDLTPGTVGEEYPESGTAVIGSEIVTFTRVDDVITLTQRAIGGSDAATHATGDSFQLCYVADNQTLPDVVNDLLVNYAGVDPSFILKRDWDAEAERWLAGFNVSTIITKPVGVANLISELSQFGVIWWWNDQTQLIQMRANRPPDFDEVVPLLDDVSNAIEKTGTTSDLYEERLSRVFFYHGVLDYTSSVTDGNNYARVAVSIDGAAETPLEYNQTQSYEVFSRWLGQAGDDSIAAPVSDRLLNRYRTTPQRISFDVDVKDVGTVDVAMPVNISSRLIQDETGNNLPTEMQITSVEEIVPGHRIKMKAQTYKFDGRYGFITEDSRPDYDLSTDEEKAKGTYIVDENTLEFSDGTGPYLMF